MRIVPQQEITDSVRSARATLIGDCGDVELVSDLDSILIGHPLLLTPAHLGLLLGTDPLSFHELLKHCKVDVWHQVHQPVHRFDATMIDADGRLQDEVERLPAAHRSVHLRQRRTIV